MVEADGAVVAVDMGDGSMSICSKHPYKNNRSNPGGICAFCLQEKLGKLVSSSQPIAVFPASTNSDSHSFRFEASYGDGGCEVRSSSLVSDQRKTRIIPFMFYHRRKKDQTSTAMARSDVFKRSKSTATPFLDGCDGDKSLQKRWYSFWYHPKRRSENRSAPTGGSSRATPNASFSQRQRGTNGVVSVSISSARRGEIAEEEEKDYQSPGSHVSSSTATSFGRKVSRSRSVGCGSRSFSVDFFERISTGLGDCTLRRVESQREGNNKAKVADSYMKERVRCGGIFSGFVVTSSSSSSSASSAVNAQMVNGKGRSWSWAFASPMRAFSKPSSVKSGRNLNVNGTPNLSAMPSLLSVGSNR